MEKLIKKLAAVALIGMTTAGAFGCAYAGMAATADGTVYVARNDLFLYGLLRKVYSCKAAGGTLTCVEAGAP